VFLEGNYVCCMYVCKCYPRYGCAWPHLAQDTGWPSSPLFIFFFFFSFSFSLGNPNCSDKAMLIWRLRLPHPLAHAAPLFLASTSVGNIRSDADMYTSMYVCMYVHSLVETQVRTNASGSSCNAHVSSGTSP